MIQAIRSGWLISTPSQVSYAQGDASHAQTTTPQPQSLTAVRAKLDTLAARLQGIDAELARAPAGSSAILKSELDAIETQLDGARTTLLRVHFSSGSAILALSAEAHEALLKAAQSAVAVAVCGGTDSKGSSSLNEHLALKRAAAVKRLLIEDGIEDQKIFVSAVATEFIATNATRAGRALNRRVDVIFRAEVADRVRIVM